MDNKSSSRNQSFRDWANQSLLTSSTLERIRCLLKICDGIAEEDREFTENILVRVLELDPDPIVRHEAAFALYKLNKKGQIAGKIALQALCKSARSDISTVARHEAAESLGF